MIKDLRIVFLGTPEFAVPTLKALISNNLKPFLVITQPDKLVGRKKILTPSPIKELAVKNNVEVAQPKNKKELGEIFNNLEVDICILVAYGMLIPDKVLSKPKHGFINVHPSLLPKYRGPSPIQSALLNGESKTGVTVMKLTAKMDEGPIIKQQEIDIKLQDNSATLHDSLSQLGGQMVIEVLPGYIAGDIEPQEQNHSEAIFCQMISRDDGQINWSKTAIEINNQFRAFYPWPGVFTNISDKRLKITKMVVLEGDLGDNMAPGQVFLDQKNTPAVMSSQGAISLILVQPEGKPEMSGVEFLNGHQELVGQVLN